MRVVKWAVQGLGIGVGVLATRILCYGLPEKPKYIPRWMFTERDAAAGKPWDTAYKRERDRHRKVEEDLREQGVYEDA